MDQLVHQKFKERAHFIDAYGVRIGCADCHLLRLLGLKRVRQLRASNDVGHTILGCVDTPEQFAAKRLALAERVWEVMAESSSRERRNGHACDHLALDRQTPRARKIWTMTR